MEILYESQGDGLKPTIIRGEDHIYSEANYPNSTNNKDPLLYKLYLYTIKNTKNNTIKAYDFDTFLEEFYTYYLPDEDIPYSSGAK